MKKTIALLLALVLCLSLFTACGSPSSPASSSSQSDSAAKDVEKLIREGDEALAAGRVDEARRKYISAGEAGEEKLTELVLQIAKNYTAGDPGEKTVQIAMGYLADLPENARKQEAVAKAMLDTIEQYLSILGNNKYSDPDEYYQPAKDLMDMILCKDLPEYNALTEKLAIQWATAHIDNRDTENVLPVWQQFSEHPTMAAVVEAAELVQQRKFTEGLSLLMEKVENYQDYDWILIQYLASYKDTSLPEAINLMAAVATVFPYQPEGMDKEGTWIEGDASFTNFSGTIEKRSGTADLTAEEIQSLHDLCGKEPNGKILMLSRRKEYDAPEIKLELSYLMNNLPTAYVPSRLEEVEYIVLVDNDYEDTGETFNVGTKLVKETAQIMVYKVGQNYPIYTSKKGETAILPTTMLMYNGEPPVYYVPSHPHMGGAMTEALKTIMKAIY